jgi:branched-chain amino acid transport system substrate-binding protein
MNIYSLLAAGIVAVLIGIFGLSQSQTEPETIKIGVIVSLTGSAARDGLSIKQGVDLAVSELVAKGVAIEVVYQDDGTDAKRTVSALQFMLATEKPQAIVGPTWSFLEDAAAPFIAKEKIVAFAPANTSEFVTISSKYQFQGAPRNDGRVEPVARWLKEHHKKRVAILVDKTSWGDSVAGPFRKAVEDAGATVVVDETFLPFDSNVGSTIAAILAKAKFANADVILWTGFDADALALIQKRQALEIDVPVLAASTVYSGFLSRGVVTEEQLDNVYFMSTPVSDSFAQKFEAKYGEKPNNFADNAYDGTMMLVEAIQNAKTKDGDGVADYLRTKLTYTREGQSYKFNESGDLIGGAWVLSPVVK